MKNCIHCNAEIEHDDNFCFSCGNITPRGYSYFNNNEKNLKILNGNAVKQMNQTITLFTVTTILITTFAILIGLRGQNILKPFIYLEKQIFRHQYGYDTSLIVNNNQYNKIIINNIEQANKQIKKDTEDQKWKCKNNIDVYYIEQKLSTTYQITSVNFCDISTIEATKINKIIEKFFMLFPETKGYLNHIAITNPNNKEDYIAYFQPIYQFVNSNEDISNYNKVNKTQILLNSYYFLNETILSSNIEDIVGEDWYVKDVTWESLIVHELGHYITFVALLKENNIDNITLITKENEFQFNYILNDINSGNFSKQLVNEALENYHTKYNNIDIENFTLSISKYAGSKNESGELIYDEAIAEAVHDYYLHGEKAKVNSLEIISVLKKKIGDRHD